jgi:hypothetical protein
MTRDARNGLLFVLVALALSACSPMPAHGPGPSMPLLTPASLGASRSAQVLHGAIGKRDVTFQCLVDASPERVTLVGLSAQGLRWFTLRYDGTTLESEVNLQSSESPDPKRVLADLQLALWPLGALQEALAGTEWNVAEPTPETRWLRRDGRLVAEVNHADPDPWRGRLWLNNFEDDYSLVVEPRPLP